MGGSNDGSETFVRLATNVSLELMGEAFTQHSTRQPFGGVTPAPVFVVVATVLLEALLIPFILFGNGAVVLLVAKNEPLRTKSNAFLVSLASADAIQGLTLIPVMLATLDPETVNGEFMCLLLWCCLLLASGCSSLSLFLVTVDRYVKIIHPLTYQQIISDARVTVAIAVVWVYTFVVVVVMPFAGLNRISDSQEFSCLDFTSVFEPVHLQVFLFLSGIFPFVSMCVMYLRLLIVVLKKLRGTRGFAGGAKGTCLARRSGRWRFMRNELRSVKTFVILLGFTALAWLPVSAVVLIEIHSGYRASLGLRSVLSWLTFMNSAVNPVVYSLRSEPFQRAMRKTAMYKLLKQCCCCCCKPRRRVRPVTSMSLTTFRKTMDPDQSRF